MFGDRKEMFGFFLLSVPLFVPLLHKLLYTNYYSEPKDVLNETNNKAQAKQEEEVDMNSSWSALDPNLLGEILDRLCLADQLRFHVVCKNWLHAHPITVRKPLLWYLSFDHSLFALQLHDPSSPEPAASVQTISLTKLGIPSPPSYKNVEATLLNHNWLFICIPTRRLFFWTRKYILLFSPFTKKIITLPTFGYPCFFDYFIITSSTQPADSPDCVFFRLDTCNADKVTILTYRNGDKEWDVKEFNRVTDFKPCLCHPLYLRGILYIVTPYGQLASYNIVDGEFRVESLFVEELFRLNVRFKRKYRVFELDGELMMMYFVKYENKNVTLPGKPCINRFDWTNKEWIPVGTLGEKSLFFSENNYQVATINKNDMTNNGVLSNKIYQFSDGGCLIYSIEDGELLEFKSVDSNLLEDGGNDLPEYKYKGGTVFLGTSTKAIYWLEPPCISF